MNQLQTNPTQQRSAGQWGQPSLDWRRYAVVFLPLALAGLLPPWALLVMALLFGLGVYLPHWAQARLASLLLGALLTLTVMLGWKQEMSFFSFFSGLSLTYFKVMAVLVLLHLALLYLEEGHRLGLLFILLAGLLAPQPGLLVALLAGAALRPGRDDMMGQQVPTFQAEQQSKRAWGAVGLVGLLLVAAAFWLPREAPALLGNSPVAGVQAGSSTALPTQMAARPHLVLPGTPPQAASDLNLPPPPGQLLAFSLLLGLGTLAWQLLQQVGTARVQRQKWALIDLLLPLGLLLNLLVIFILGLVHNHAEVNRPSVPWQSHFVSSPLNITVEGRHLHLSPTLVTGAAWLLWLLALLLVVLALVGLLLTSRQRRRNQPLHAAFQPLTAPDEPLHAAAAASNRVRLAYAQASQALISAGYPRQPAETPSLYAARLAQFFPALAGSFLPLTQMYMPVRYGGDAGDMTAQQAEQAAADVLQLAAQLPPPSEETKTP